MSRFGGFSKSGITPTGGVPAGPFNSSWSCPGLRDVVGVVIIGCSYKGLKKSLAADPERGPYKYQVRNNQTAATKYSSTVTFDAGSIS